MIAVDTNLLAYAHGRGTPFHESAKALFEELRTGARPWAIPWPSVHEFISVTTNPKIFASTLADALAFLDGLFTSPNLNLLSESPGYFDKLRCLATEGRIKGARIHDARIAALCLHHGVSELWTADRDFSAFPQIKTRNPLSSEK